MPDDRMHVDPVYITFSTVMRVLTLIGIVIMVACGFLYFAGLASYLEPSVVAENWGKPATVFWQEAKGIEVNDYSWFLSNLRFMDPLSMLGVALLALTPLVSVVVMISRSKKVYAVLLSILTAEFIFSIIRPIVFLRP